MTTIVSIHQPNNDLFQMFDNIYVLAKGGVCVYSGPPSSLRQHLIDCEIECNETQIPIEVMLDMSAKEKTNPKLQNLVQKSRIECKDIKNTQNLKQTNRIQNPRKGLYFIDFYLLIKRNISVIYRRKWFELLIQIGIYLIIGFMVKFTVNEEITKPDGCLDLSSALSCETTSEDIRNFSLINQNLRYNYFFVFLISCFVMSMSTVNFRTEFKILRNENRNGM